jgi:hypothetical protein
MIQSIALDSTIEWWYQDFQKLVIFKIYPVFPAVRPSILRFITSTSPSSKDHNETDITDVSVLLRHVNVDDSGIYRCVIRPWTPSHTNNIEDNLSEGISNLPALTYHIHLTGLYEDFRIKSRLFILISFTSLPSKFRCITMFFKYAY